MFPRLLPALMAGLFVGLAAGQAHAGLFDDEEARLRINEMRNEFNGRVSKLESGARAQLELADQIELLKTEIARLRKHVAALEKTVTDRDTELAQAREALEVLGKGVAFLEALSSKNAS